MEKKNNKRKVMLIAAFAVAVIALAGIGYATVSTTSYKATTVNDGNNATSKYIAVEQDGDYSADFGTAVEFNTYTDSSGSGATKVIYTLTDNQTVVDSYKGFMLGDVVLTMTSATTMTNYNLKAIKYAGTLADGWTYILKVGSNVLYYNSTHNNWTTAATGDGDDTITVTSGCTVQLWIASTSLFQSLSPTITTLSGYADYPASRTAPASDLVDNVTLLFEITGNYTEA